MNSDGRVVLTPEGRLLHQRGGDPPRLRWVEVPAGSAEQVDEVGEALDAVAVHVLAQTERVDQHGVDAGRRRAPRTSYWYASPTCTSTMPVAPVTARASSKMPGSGFARPPPPSR